MNLKQALAAVVCALLLSACCGRSTHSVASGKCASVGSTGCNNCCRVNGAQSGVWGASCVCYR